jgi:hypothetical protein
MKEDQEKKQQQTEKKPYEKPALVKEEAYQRFSLTCSQQASKGCISNPAKFLY